MATQAKVTVSATAIPMKLGWTKFLRDVASIFEIKLIAMSRAWYFFLMGTLIFPVSMFYFAQALAPDTPEAIRRALAGTMIFGAAMLTTNMLAQSMIQDRFQGRLKLIITMPVSKGAYAIGSLVFSASLSAATMLVILGFAVAVGVQFTLSWAFLPLLLGVMLTMSGLTILIVSYAPTAEVGNIMTNLTGILLAFVSPVFFTMEQAPAVMRALGWVSPLRYAADGLMKSLSGQPDVGLELTVLTGFAVLAMALGLWRLRWRER